MTIWDLIDVYTLIINDIVDFLLGFFLIVMWAKEK